MPLALSWLSAAGDHVACRVGTGAGVADTLALGIGSGALVGIAIGTGGRGIALTAGTAVGVAVEGALALDLPLAAAGRKATLVGDGTVGTDRGCPSPAALAAIGATENAATRGRDIARPITLGHPAPSEAATIGPGCARQNAHP